MLRSGTHPVLGAFGVELQRVEALRRARDLSFDFSTQLTVRHTRTLPHRQDLRTHTVLYLNSGPGYFLHSDLRRVSHHVLVEGRLPLAAAQREGGGGGQRAEVPQRQRRTPATQLQRHKHRNVTCAGETAGSHKGPG